MKKVFLITLLSLLFFSFFISISVFAGGTGCPTEGLVPCGNVDTCPCELCDFFVMVERWIDRTLIIFVPIIAVLMIAVGGFMYIIGRGSPEMLSRAKSLLTSVAIGLLIIYGAFIFIGFFLWFIGLADWTTDIYHNWWEEGFFEIPCP